MSRERIVRMLLITLATMTAALFAVLLLVVLAQQGRILPGTTVVGVDVGRLDPASARRVLGPALAAEGRHPLRVSLPGEQVLLDPRTVGLEIDVPGTVADAFRRGRRPTPTSIAARLLAPARTVEIAPRRDVDEALVAAWVDAVAARLDREGSLGDLRIGREDGSYAVAAIGPHGAVNVDREESVARLRSALLAGQRQVALAVAVDLPPVGRAPIERIAGDVAHALREPLRLRHDGRTLSIAPETLVRLFELDTAIDYRGRPVPALTVPVERVRTLLGPEARTTFDRPARDARIITQRVPSTTLTDLGSTSFRPVAADITIEAGASRVTFLPARTATQITGLIAQRRRAAIADVDERDPGLPTAAVLEGRPTHLLGTFTTFYAAGGARTVNIHLLADILDDRLIAPGETFSINETSGPRRCEDGFLPAGTIVRGELVETCGGGVSQIGTTVVNAAFFAGVPLEQWQPHSFFISRYPAGREATLSYPELDVRFTNDTNGYLVLRASTTPESVTVSIYGAPRWSRVTADHGERRAPTDFGQEERLTTSLRPGARRVIQSGGGGFTITVVRARTPIDERAEVSRERWTTVYRPQQRIVEVGAQPAPAPEPEPAPE